MNIFNHLAVVIFFLVATSNALAAGQCAELFSANKNSRVSWVAGKLNPGLEGFQNGILLGRSGKNIEFNNVDGSIVVQNKIVEHGDYRTGKQAVIQGHFLGTGEKVLYESSAQARFGNELVLWSMQTGKQYYGTWPVLKLIPEVLLKSFQEHFKGMYPEKSLPEIYKFIGAKNDAEFIEKYPSSYVFVWQNFRNILPAILKEAVRRHVEINVNLAPKDEVFLRELNALQPSERAAMVKNLIGSYYRSDNKKNSTLPMNQDGFITRYELLVLCSDSQLFRHAKFFRNYQNEILFNEKQDLWIGID